MKYTISTRKLTLPTTFPSTGVPQLVSSNYTNGTKIPSNTTKLLKNYVFNYAMFIV